MRATGGAAVALCALVALLAAAAATTTVRADVYMHNPRGSNNRLNETPNNRNNANRMFDSQNNNRGGYNQGFIYFYAGSVLPIEWTNQHGCGANPNTHCEIVLQWACEDTLGIDMRDGASTRTIPFPAPDIDTFEYGRHETEEFYSDCRTRQRNRGLFTSDQTLRGTSAIYTRQNPNGNRYGYECPEERDYYPYWHPTPWKDIAVLTSTPSRCAYYQAESENVKGRYYCTKPAFNTYLSCNASGGQWLQAPSHGIAAPACEMAPYSRDNHLGNSHNGFPAYWNWTLPADAAYDQCALRIRYNVSTNDYNAWDSRINASLNGKNKLRTASGFFLNDNPTVDFGVGSALALAINTDQYGRTFQDRTHVFSVRARPASLPADATVYNLNVRGKRGNIVQVYPAVEYDFVPNVLVAQPGDYVHFQWTGSNTNDPNNDGQGLRGSDRSNIVLIHDLNYNYPGNLTSQRIFVPSPPANTSTEYRAWFDLIKSIATLNQGDDELDDAAPYFDAGAYRIDEAHLTAAWGVTNNAVETATTTAAAVYNYMCTRNNNFSNRSQKGRLEVVAPETAVNVGAVVGGTVAGASAVGATTGGLVYAYKTGKLATLVGSCKGAAAAPTAV